MMRIAVASEGKNVTEHFGHCEGFLIYILSVLEKRAKEHILGFNHQVQVLECRFHFSYPDLLNKFESSTQFKKLKNIIKKKNCNFIMSI